MSLGSVQQLPQAESVAGVNSRMEIFFMSGSFERLNSVNESLKGQYKGVYTMSTLLKNKLMKNV